MNDHPYNNGEGVENPALDFLTRACALFYGLTKEHGNMRCPHCTYEIAELWQPVAFVTNPEGKALSSPQYVLWGKKIRLLLQWMQCHNAECQQIIVQIRQQGPEVDQKGNPIPSATWFAFPQRSTPRPIDPTVPQKYAKDYKQAAVVLEYSPGAAAALARRILGSVLIWIGQQARRFDVAPGR